MESKETKFSVDDVSPRLELFPKEKPKLGRYCSITTPFCNFGTVPFLTGLYNAYTHHCPLKFSPDDFWLLIIQDFSYYVNAHAKKLRKQLVTFEGRKEIKAYIPKFTKEELTKSDYKDATSLVISKIPNFLQNKTILDTMTQQFSTSTTDILHVKQITAMNTLKSYFYYRYIEYGCGIPYITLTGTVEDYEKIIKGIDELMTINPRLKKIKSIMEKVLDTKRGNIDEKFCQNMIKKNVNKEYITASASVIGKIKRDFISGWIMDFINYNSEGKKIHKKYYKKGYNVKYIPNLQSQVYIGRFYLSNGSLCRVSWDEPRSDDYGDEYGYRMVY